MLGRDRMSNRRDRPSAHHSKQSPSASKGCCAVSGNWSIGTNAIGSAFLAQIVVLGIRNRPHHLIGARRILWLRHHLHQLAERLCSAKILSHEGPIHDQYIGRIGPYPSSAKPRPVSNGMPIVAK